MYRVVVLDDEEMIRFGIISILSRYGSTYIVVGEAGNGEEGFILVKSLKPDIVITDIRMPKGTGLDVLKKMAEESIKCKTIILTAYADFEYAQKALVYNAVSYILKPIDEDKLLSELERITRKEEITCSIEIEETIAADLMDQLLMQNKNIHSIVYRTLKYIAVNFKRSISLDEISVELKVTPSYISKLFSDNMNIGLVNFLNNFRVDIAKQLLLKTDYKIYEIASKLGFCNPKYFCKVFSDIVSLSPTDFVNRNIR